MSRRLIPRQGLSIYFTTPLISGTRYRAGTRNLLDLMISAETDQPRFYYCSSLASVLGRPFSDGIILERISDEPSTASPIGYSQSKWVTEKICRHASERGSLDGNAELRVHVLRVGQLCGDTNLGHWNEKEGWPLLIRTAQTTGCLPLLADVSKPYLSRARNSILDDMFMYDTETLLASGRSGCSSNVR